MQFLIWFLMSGGPVVIGTDLALKKTLFKDFKLKRSRGALKSTSRDKLQSLVTWASLCTQAILWNLVGYSHEQRFPELTSIFLALGC